VTSPNYQPATVFCVRSRLWPDTERGPWEVKLHWQEIKGRFECVGVTINSSAMMYGEDFDRASTGLPDVGIPIKSTVMRSINLAELIAEERMHLGNLGRFLASETASGFAQKMEAPESTMRPATAKRLRLVAEAYRKAWQQGKPPVKAVAKRLAVSDAAASKLVFRARSAGLLPQTSAGVPSAIPKDPDPKD
jgi:hypothetical protein